MIQKRLYAILLFAVAVLMLAGCGAHEGNASQSVEEVDAHAGHNHAPGEHGKAVAQATSHDDASHDWCSEHSVPESECTKCNPGLIEQFKNSGDWCAGHELPESHCRLCNPGLEFAHEREIHAAEIEIKDEEIQVSLFFRPNAEICATDGALIQFASASTVARAGIGSRSVRAARLQQSFEAPAEVVFDETRAAVVGTTVPALVSRWLVSPGDEVVAGQGIAIMRSPEIADLQARLLASAAACEVQERELARHDELLARELISRADYERQEALTAQTRAELAAARGLLLAAGMNNNDLNTVLAEREVSSSFVLRAPSAGILVERRAQLGDLLAPGSALGIVADSRTMWLEARLTEEQLRYVDVGQTLTFSGDGRGLDRVGGKVIWVSNYLDPHSRTGIVRAEINATGHNLQAGEFGRVQINLPDENKALLVPKDAVQWEGCCNVVFVKEAEDRYRPRKVRFTQGEGPYYQVTEGLNFGDEVVVEGAFLLKTELKKTSLGSGCCGLEPTS